jgi:hypothetical protein
MKTHVYINVVLFFVVVTLVLVNSKLLYHLNPDSIIANKEAFSFSHLGNESIIAIITALGFSIMTAVVIKAICLPIARIWNFLLILLFAMIDGLGIWLYYSVLDDYRIWASLYYGFYMFAIIATIGLNQTFIGAKTRTSNAIEDLINKIVARERYLKKSHLSVVNDAVLNSLKKELGMLNK